MFDGKMHLWSKGGTASVPLASYRLASCRAVVAF